MKECLVDGERAIDAHDQAPVIVDPSERALRLPALPVASSQRAAVLRQMRRDQVDAARGQLLPIVVSGDYASLTSDGDAA